MILKKLHRNGAHRLAMSIVDLLIFYGAASLVICLSESYAMADMVKAYRHLNSVMDENRTVDSNALRFLNSYEMGSAAAQNPLMGDTAYIYDNALALMAYLNRHTGDDIRRAKIIADAFIYALYHDRYFHDGRLRNAYSAKKLFNPESGNANLPGYWDPVAQKWCEDEEQASSYTGNMAWVIIALSRLYKAQGNDDYKKGAVVLGNWIYHHTYEDRGYTGGEKGWEPDPVKIHYKSTEHNIDVYAAFSCLYAINGDSSWRERASHAKNFVDSMWRRDHFLIGTQPDGKTNEENNPPLDVQALAVLAFAAYPAALQWALDYCYTESDGFKGFDFNTDKDGIWFEGTAQMSLALMTNHQKDAADKFLAELRRAQISARNANGRGIVAASHDFISTGLGWRYFNRPHVGATCWYIFAESGFNPLSESVVQ